MTDLSAQTIRRRSHLEGMIFPFSEPTEFDGLSYGLGPASYDVRIDLQEENTSIICPGFNLFSTIEYFKIPINLKATVHDKSTWVRRGIGVHNTLFDPGFHGYGTIEIINHTSRSWPIKHGTPIAQLVFTKLDEPTEMPYSGKYQNQERGPQEAR